MADFSISGTLRQGLSRACLLLGLMLAAPLCADRLEIVVRGVEDPLLGNVKARTQSFRVAGKTRLTRRRLENMRADAERRATAALRPFGFYHPAIRSEVRSTGDRTWEIVLDIQRGPAVIVSDYRVEVHGPGEADQTLLDWKTAWPLTAGSVLNQRTWGEEMEEALRLAEAHGYLGAEFVERKIELDLEQNRAGLTLILDTGEQAVMGSIEFQQDLVNPAVLEHIPRFREGEPYDAWLLEQFRLDLWRTGYFNNIEVLEERRLEDDPPRVNLVVNMEPRNLNTYQGSVGFGSDTGIRFQAMWNRHLLSSRGDSLDVGFGWQDQYNEMNLRVNYRQPRKVEGRQYWTMDLLYRTEDQAFKISPIDDPDRRITVARGNVDDYSFKPGWLRVLNIRRGQQQIFEHWYIQYLNERTRFRPLDDIPDPVSPLLVAGDNPESVSQPSKTWSVGVSWEWPVIRGNAFNTVGHRHEARIFTSNTAWGSDIDFTQAYLSSRWNVVFGERWKFLWRGELGYTNADVNERIIDVLGEAIRLSVTDLPYAYRFKAGGSQSVRGYGFENLSNNNIGSNNIVTASVELEMQIVEDWSVAAFFDAGNAFNDWDNIDLRKGAGAGIRWYSIAGAMRLDFAQGFDEPGKGWNIHFTIGTPLL